MNKLAAHRHSTEHPNMSKLGYIENCEDESSYLSSSQQQERKFIEQCEFNLMVLLFRTKNYVRKRN